MQKPVQPFILACRNPQEQNSTVHQVRSNCRDTHSSFVMSFLTLLAHTMRVLEPLVFLVSKSLQKRDIVAL